MRITLSHSHSTIVSQEDTQEITLPRSCVRHIKGPIATMTTAGDLSGNISGSPDKQSSPRELLQSRKLSQYASQPEEDYKVFIERSHPRQITQHLPVKAWKITPTKPTNYKSQQLPLVDCVRPAVSDGKSITSLLNFDPSPLPRHFPSARRERGFKGPKTRI